MAQINAFRTVIDLWTSREEMALEIGARSSAVSKWWQRDSIPAEWWASVLSTKRAEENGVTAEVLTSLASRETAESRV